MKAVGEWVDLGHDHKMRLVAVDGMIIGGVLQHPVAGTEGGDRPLCEPGLVQWEPAGSTMRPIFTLESGRNRPVSLAPFIVCSVCGDKGWIISGQWHPKTDEEGVDQTEAMMVVETLGEDEDIFAPAIRRDLGDKVLEEEIDADRRLVDVSGHGKDVELDGEEAIERARVQEKLRNMLNRPVPWCPSAQAGGREDRCGLFSHPPRCDGETCTAADSGSKLPMPAEGDTYEDPEEGRTPDWHEVVGSLLKPLPENVRKHAGDVQVTQQMMDDEEQRRRILQIYAEAQARDAQEGVSEDDPKESLRKSLLDEALNLITGDRNNAYGPPHQDFQRTADMVTAMWGDKLKDGAKIEAHDVAQFVMCIKLSRLQWSPMKRDNWTDIVGYAGCGYEAFRLTHPEIEET